MTNKTLFLIVLAIPLFIIAGCSRQNSSIQTIPTEPEVSVLTENNCTEEGQPPTTSAQCCNVLEMIEIDHAYAICGKIVKPAPGQVTLYKGTWFDIKYPKEFTPSSIADEARFLSPDGTVEFFVFSPQWGGNPVDYLTTKASEELVSEKTDTTGADLKKKIVRWVTVKAKDGSYYRSFVSIKAQVGTGSDLHYVFGIKYENDAAYQQYRDAYIAFKASLSQYAD